MNRKLAVMFAATSLLLSGCVRDLRSDIAKFITSFSLEDCFATYKEASYISTKNKDIDGVKTKEIKKMEISTVDPENPAYDLSLNIYDENDVLTHSERHYIERREEGFFLIKNQEETPYSLEECHALILTFFYKTTLYEDTPHPYHSGGMYYGDHILEMARDIQDFLSIDEENNLLVFHHEQSGVDTEIIQTYSINSLGMLESNYFYARNGTNTQSETIVVTHA